MNIRPFVVIGILALLLSGCAPLAGQGQSGIGSTGTDLSAGQTVGQSFTALHGGLVALGIYLAPNQTGSGTILLHLRASSGSKADLATASLPISQVNHSDYYNFNFTPQAGSYLRDYYIQMEVQGPGKISVGSAGGDSYLDGSLYLNDQPVDAQLSFHLFYTFHLAVLAILGQAAGWLWQLILAALLFLVPGWAILSGLWPGWAGLSWGEKSGLAAGTSIIVYPILFLWSYLVGLHLGALYGWIPLAAGAIFLAWQNRGLPAAAARLFRSQAAIKNLVQTPPAIYLPDLALVLVLGMMIIVRLWTTRTLSIPMWGDSYQHTLMAQLLVDHGGLFNSWQPYADLQTFTYHFGFHTAVAVYHWLSGASVPTAVIQVGQWLNVLAVLALYPLVVRLTRQRWAGTAAVLVAGLLLSIPMIYVNWGRYTQLAGQLAMPAVICLSWGALEHPGRSWRSIALAGIAMGGLALTHYRILIFAACFFPAWLLFNLKGTTWRGAIRRLSALAAIAIGVCLPWFIHVYGGQLMHLIFRQVTAFPSAASSAQDTGLAGVLTGYLPAVVWVALVGCLAWGLWRRERGILIFSLWWLFVTLAVNPQWIRLPGEGALTSFALAIAAYIPAGVLIGAAVGWFMAQNRWKDRTSLNLVLLAIVIGAGIVGSRQQLREIDLNGGTIVTRPDLRAMIWIAANTPADSRFLVNSFFAYGGSSVVGSDGGWWLPLLAHRQSSLPPLTYVSEQGYRPNYVQYVNQMTQSLLEIGLNDPGSMTLLKKYGITFLYVGQRQGRVNYNGPVLIDPLKLSADPHFQVVYHQDRVWIFKLAP